MRLRPQRVQRPPGVQLAVHAPQPVELALRHQPVPEIRLDLFQLFDPKELGKYFTDAEMQRLDARPPFSEESAKEGDL